MIRRVDLLITSSRNETENTTVTDTTGIQDAEFLRYLNDAQVQAQTIISSVNANLFQVEATIPTVANQENYSIPWDSFIGNRIDLVEYSSSSSPNHYYELQKGTLPERMSGSGSTSPSFYIRRSGEILLQPRPTGSGALIRLTYQKRLARLDTRRGQVDSVTLDTVNRTITSLVLDSSQAIDQLELEEQGFITIVDLNGIQKMRRIPISGVDISTGIVTVEAGFVYEEGETIAVGNYALAGEDSTTHSSLPDICERYLMAYCNWKILKRDSSTDSMEASAELQSLQASIIDAFSETDTDVDRVTILDDQFLISEDFYY